jgi:hypothetical protein
VGSIIILITLVLYFLEAKRGNPSTKPRLAAYNHLQVWLMFLNVVGIVAAIWLG